MNIEAEKYLSTYIAKNLSGLPYEKAKIQRTEKTYHSSNTIKNFSFEVKFEVNEKLANKSDLDKWLTERYCLYYEAAKKIFRYDVHHKEWPLRSMTIKNLNVNYKIGDISLINLQPGLSHYSEGVRVLAWAKQIASSATR